MAITDTKASRDLVTATEYNTIADTVNQVREEGLGQNLTINGATFVGFVLNNLTTTERDNISTPPTGAVIFNTTTSKINVYNGSSWEVVTST